MKADKKNLLIKLIDEIPESKIPEVIGFILSLKNNRHDQEFKELMYASVCKREQHGFLG